MKIICKQQELLAALNIALKAVSGKTNMAILECVLIEAYYDKIKLSTSNMELSIETLIAGRIDVEGKVALNAKIFSEIIRKLPDERVIIEVDENSTTSIFCGSAKFMIAGLSGDDFPVMPAMEKQDSVSISQFTLKEVIRQTIFSVSDNENNKVMTGEHFEIDGNKLVVTSLDGHRISIRNVELKGNYSQKDVIIPGKTLIEISKILEGDAEKEVLLYFDKNNVMFELDDTIILSRLIEGRYLNVKQMINYDYNTKFTINKKQFFDCFDRATLLIKESDKKPVIMGIYKDKLTLNMNTSLGSLDEEIEVDMEGNDLLIGFNPKFIMDVLKVIDDEEITIYLTNAKAPCYIRDEKTTYNYLVLPVNFNTI
ncbi:MAG: DNA polymerase III subunit beta [Lachnospiraceae bacterium]